MQPGWLSSLSHHLWTIEAKVLSISPFLTTLEISFLNKGRKKECKPRRAGAHNRAATATVGCAGLAKPFWGRWRAIHQTDTGEKKKRSIGWMEGWINGRNSEGRTDGRNWALEIHFETASYCSQPGSVSPTWHCTHVRDKISVAAAVVVAFWS